MRFYGKWMRDEAEKRMGHLYPKIEITAEMAKGRSDLTPLVGKTLTVIRMAVGSYYEEPEPGVREHRRAACVDVHALDEGRQ